MGFQPITAAELRIGLFIKIEGSWFSHPFPTNTFKIKFQKDLETLRGLRKVKLHYDPDRSDPEGVVSENEPSGRSDIASSESSEHPDTQADETPEDAQASATQNLVDQKVELKKDFQRYQEQLKKVEDDYRDVLREGKVMLHDISGGNARGLMTAKKMVGSLNDILVSNDSSRALMNLMGSQETSEEFLMHALNVATLSILIARDLGVRRHEIEKIAVGAMLHDIGELKYSGEMLLKKSSASSGETKAILKKHTKYGKDMLAAFPNFPHESLDIIYQHHERLNGSGYPLGVRESSINFYAKIVMVADEYDELCNNPDPAKCLTPSEALSFLYAKQRGVLWHDAIVTLVRQLGVYPPGSLVALSDGSIGLVTSVNMEARLRPIIMVYSQDIPKEEAMVIDLTQHEHLSIKESIRPKELSPEIRDYLNPRRVISYYPSSPDPEEVEGQVEAVAAVVAQEV